MTRGIRTFESAALLIWVIWVLWGRLGSCRANVGWTNRRHSGVSLQTLSGLGANMIGCIAR